MPQGSLRHTWLDLSSCGIQDHLPLSDDGGSSVFEEGLLDVPSDGVGFEGEDNIVLQASVREFTHVGLGLIENHRHWHQILERLWWEGKK